MKVHYFSIKNKDVNDSFIYIKLQLVVVILTLIYTENILYQVVSSSVACFIPFHWVAGIMYECSD